MTCRHVQFAFVLGCALLATLQSRLMFIELNETAARAHFYSKQLDNHHIVMVGDSLMRYQYLSLVYLVHTNTFYPGERRPSILFEKDFGNWNLYFNLTTATFYPNEYCDCYRMSNYVTNENRYYYHKERNISITYLLYQGDSDDNKIHGHWHPSDKETNHQYHPASPVFIPYRWEADSIQEALFDIAAKLEPKPSVLILNAGIWPNRYAEAGHRASVLKLAVSLFDRVIWKTTSFIWRENHTTPSSYDICQHVECLDIYWTGHLLRQDYRDLVHFNADIYTDIDIQLITQLTHKDAILAYVPMGAAFYGKIVQHKNLQYFVDHEGLLRPFTSPVENEGNKQCVEKLNNRIHIQLPAQTLRKHILGTSLPDICGVLG